VAEVITAKMMHRHPHVFGDTRVEGAADVVLNWERLKRSEGRRRVSVLDGVPGSLPALAFAQGMQKRPARIGFDATPTVADAMSEVESALHGLRRLAQEAPRRAEPGEDWTGDAAQGRDLEAAFGEVLFALVALARQLRVNPEEALRARSVSFAQRFRALEAQAREDGVDLHELSAGEWRRRWEESG